MLHQPPKCESEVLAKAKRQKKKNSPPEMEVPSFTHEELDKLLDSSAIHQEILHMRHKGVSPFQAKLMSQASLVTADVVDAVRWQDLKADELETMKLQDATKTNPWVDEVLEDFIAFDIAPSNTEDEAKTILKELNKELEAKMDAGYGPDARNYINGLKRELDLIVEKLSGSKGI
jgi:hypothetical protein